ncbi:MAG: 23S rRNA (adenine(2503)-C(2))-methyltransferase RlmN [Deltaproteobacteria bacterium]|nr:23S rRNA (adenine(2503)-C(2))-methyltransferase RlmN [Deltaproteobacteria bacterium]MBW2413423.1 23S rRNA (adenine(2503)-C(2))-methyltransferase RlmN [Deltaproteobacteria bacterium]
MRSVLTHTPEEFRDALVEEGVEGFRAQQILRWLHGRGVREFAEMSDLSRELRADLGNRWSTRALELREAHVSSDGTEKLVLQTGDRSRIEAVMIPEQDRRTLCVSSQVGCSLDCSFCATARLGFGRNLDAAEIVDQVLHASGRLRERGERLTHVVFMGMGEPLLNLREVVRAIRVMTDPGALALSRRRITVSTAGVVPRIAELGRQVRVRLAVSLHATTDELRNELVPLNRRFPLASLLQACREFPLPPRDRLSFEYTLIDGVNDSEADARRLVKLLHGLRAKVNAIPLNEHPASSYRRPSPDRVERFASTLARSGVTVSVRRSRGDDILAACGQLGAVRAAPAAADATVSDGRLR